MRRNEIIIAIRQVTHIKRIAEKRDKTFANLQANECMRTRSTLERGNIRKKIVECKACAQLPHVIYEKAFAMKLIDLILIM